MYRFSRAIYRELADEIIEDPHTVGACTQPRARAARLRGRGRAAGNRPPYFARPSRTLFCDIRAYFPMTAQLRVLQVIERYIGARRRVPAPAPQNGFDVYGNPLQCRASTRKGTPCQRMPLPHNGYCPSHQHLAETEEIEAALAAVVEGRFAGPCDRLRAAGPRLRLRRARFSDRAPDGAGAITRPCSWASTSAAPSPTRCSRSTAGSSPPRRRPRRTTSPRA